MPAEVMQNSLISAAQREQFIADGYMVVSGLIPDAVVEATRRQLLDALNIDPQDPTTWTAEPVSRDLKAIALTAACRTEAIEEVAQELAGAGFVRGVTYSPFLESQGLTQDTWHGFIPVLNYPTPGPRLFEPPRGYHIDGMHTVTLWPGKLFLVVFAYLTDTAEYGGATTVRPGSHRQVFEHWRSAGDPGNTAPPDLPYADPVPLPGKAGDVIFMHYLMVHSGSSNHSDHIRVGLNTTVLPDPARPYQQKTGPPQPDWTPLDYTLRTDTPNFH